MDEGRSDEATRDDGRRGTEDGGERTRDDGRGKMDDGRQRAKDGDRRKKDEGRWTREDGRPRLNKCKKVLTGQAEDGSRRTGVRLTGKSRFDIKIRSTHHLIELIKQGKLPDKIMLNVYPQITLINADYRI